MHRQNSGMLSMRRTKGKGAQATRISSSTPLVPSRRATLSSTTPRMSDPAPLAVGNAPAADAPTAADVPAATNAPAAVAAAAAPHAPPPVGARFALGADRGTVRYVGAVPPAAGVWLGVEWDEAARGKHDGSHAGVRYFSTR